MVHGSWEETQRAQRFMESSLFLSDLLTDHEPDRQVSVAGATESCHGVGWFMVHGKRRKERRGSWKAPCSFRTCSPTMNPTDKFLLQMRQKVVTASDGSWFMGRDAKSAEVHGKLLVPFGPAHRP